MGNRPSWGFPRGVSLVKANRRAIRRLCGVSWPCGRPTLAVGHLNGCSWVRAAGEPRPLPSPARAREQARRVNAGLDLLEVRRERGDERRSRGHDIAGGGGEGRTEEDTTE